MSKLALVVVLTALLSVVSDGKTRLCHLLDDDTVFLAQYEEKCSSEVVAADLLSRTGKLSGSSTTFSERGFHSTAYSKSGGHPVNSNGEPIPLMQRKSINSTSVRGGCSTTTTLFPRVNHNC